MDWTDADLSILDAERASESRLALALGWDCALVELLAVAPRWLLCTPVSCLGRGVSQWTLRGGRARGCDVGRGSHKDQSRMYM